MLQYFKRKLDCLPSPFFAAKFKRLLIIRDFKFFGLFTLIIFNVCYPNIYFDQMTFEMKYLTIHIANIEYLLGRKVVKGEIFRFMVTPSCLYSLKE